MSTHTRRSLLALSGAISAAAVGAIAFGTPAAADGTGVSAESIRKRLHELGGDITNPVTRHRLIPPNSSRTAIAVGRPRARDEALAALRALSGSDLQPTGQYLPAGRAIVVNVNAVDGKLPTLLVSAPSSHPDEEFADPRSHPLTPGRNEVTDPGGGLAYLSLEGDGELAIVEFSSGTVLAPWLLQGETTAEQFREQLSSRPDSPQVELVSPYAMVTVTREAMTEYLAQDQERILGLLEQVIARHAATSGMDSSAAQHHRPVSTFHLVESPRMPDGAGAYATHGWTAYPRTYMDRLLSVEGLNSNGWGVWHELGHQHQQFPYKPSATTEVTVNIYSLAIQRELGLESNLTKPDDNGASQYDLVWPKLGTDGLSFLDDFGGMEMLVQYQQLTLAYGEDFWPEVHKLVRVERPDGGDFDDNAWRFHLLMVYTSRVAGEDLRDFYRRWGMSVDPRTDAELDDLGLPLPAVDPSTLRED
ncbi:MAG: M60 family metallopeptidase [Stackebrandtia sp.]